MWTSPVSYSGPWPPHPPPCPRCSGPLVPDPPQVALEVPGAGVTKVLLLNRFIKYCLAV